MSNDFYNASGYPAARSAGSSAPARNEFANLALAFDRMPALSGNQLKLLRVNGAGTGLEAYTHDFATVTYADTKLPLVGGNLVGPGNLGVGGTLGVTGAATLAATLNVAGVTTLAAMTATSGGFSAGVTVGTTLGVTGAATLGSLGVAAGLTVGTTLGVTGAATVGGTLGVTGALNGTSAAFSAGVTIGTTLGVTGAATVGGTLGVTGTTTLNNALSVTTSGLTTGISLTDTGASGANIRLAGNGGATPIKFIRSFGGNLEVVSSTYAAVLLTVSDTGNLTTTLSTTSSAFIPSAATVPSNGMYLPAANTLGWSISSALKMSLNTNVLDAVVGVSAQGTPTITTGATRYGIGNIGGNPSSVIIQSTGAANEKIWDNFAGTNTLVFRAVNDAFSGANGWLTVTRTGFTIAHLIWGASMGFGAAPGLGHTIDMQGPGGAGGSLGGVNNIGGCSDTGAYSIWAGRSVLNGAYAQIFSASHATNANQFIIGTSSTSRLTIGATGIVDVVAGSGFLTVGQHRTRFETAELSCPTTSTLINSAIPTSSRIPDIVQWVLRNKITEGGYSVGDEVIIKADVGAGTKEWNFWNSVGNMRAFFIGAGATPSIRDTTGTLFAITAANWRVVGRAIWL